MFTPSELSVFDRPFLHLWRGSSGVLLLNAVLTVRAHQANSHKDKGWETFTDTVVQWLSTNLEGLVFMLWGSYAQKKGAAINRVGGPSPVLTCTPPATPPSTKTFWYLWFTETSPHSADRTSISFVCSSRLLWVQAFLKGQWDADQIWKEAYRLEGALKCQPWYTCVDQLQEETNP